MGIKKISESLTKENRIAIVGVSVNSKKWGRKIFEKLKADNFCVYPINPKHKKIGKDVCYPNLRSLPEKPAIVITVVSPKITERIAKECKNLGITKIWMQPGSESDKVITFCRDNNIEASFNTCFVMNSKEGN